MNSGFGLSTMFGVVVLVTCHLSLDFDDRAGNGTGNR